MRWLGVVAFLAWCLFLVATSSTVIRPHDFLAWFAAHVFTDEVSFRRFVVFWGYSWFIIVKGGMPQSSRSCAGCAWRS